MSVQEHTVLRDPRVEHQFATLSEIKDGKCFYNEFYIEELESQSAWNSPKATKTRSPNANMC